MITKVALPERIVREIKMRDMRIALAVADAGGVVKAAESINMTQPSVSRCIQQLERRLGVSLFSRSHLGMSLTPYGVIFVGRCRQILADVRTLGAEIDSIAHGIKGQILVGAMPIAVNTFLPQALIALQRRFPDLTVAVREGTERDLIDDLRNRRIEMAVGRLMPAVDHPDLENEVLLNDPLCFVVRRGHPLLRRTHPSVAQALAYRWVFPTRDSPAHKALSAAFRTTGLEEPKVAIHTSSISCIVRVVSQSDYIGTVPVKMFEFGIEPGNIRRLGIDLDSTVAPIGISKLRGRELLPGVRRFEEVLRETCASIVGAPGTPGSRARPANR
jgi:DNA-binding transcriptional LysR family regulator